MVEWPSVCIVGGAEDGLVDATVALCLELI